MRKSLYILISLIIVSHLLKAQDYSPFDINKFQNKYFSRDYSKVLKLNPWNYLIGVIPVTMEFGGSAEMMIKNHQSSEIGVAYLTKNIFVLMFEDTLKQMGSNQRFYINGGRIQYTHKFYLKNGSNIDPLGFYIGFHFSYAATKISTTVSRPYNNFLVISHFNTNLNFGYQFNPVNDIVVDVFLGIGYKKNTWKEYNPINNLKSSTSNISTVNTSDFGSYYNSPIRYSIGIRVGIGLE